MPRNNHAKRRSFAWLWPLTAPQDPGLQPWLTRLRRQFPLPSHYPRRHTTMRLENHCLCRPHIKAHRVRPFCTHSPPQSHRIEVPRPQIPFSYPSWVLLQKSPTFLSALLSQILQLLFFLIIVIKSDSDLRTTGLKIPSGEKKTYSP